jgi:hypothetical protein
MDDSPSRFRIASLPHQKSEEDILSFRLKKDEDQAGGDGNQNKN